MPALYDVNGTIGALLIALFITTYLFGVSSVQAYLYHTSFPNDRISWKLMVLLVWLLELAHCICICHSFFTIAILGWGNIFAIASLPKSFAFSILLSGAIGTISQCFFTERIRIVSGSLIVPTICWALSIFRAVLVAVATCEAFGTISLHNFESKWKWLCLLILALGAAVDFFIAVILCFYLNTMHKSKDNPSTSFMIDKISIWTIQTGLLSSLTGISILICFLTMPGNFVWLGIYTFLVRLFSNSLFASLNGRVILRESRRAMQYINTPNLHDSSPGSTAVAIHITRLVEVKTDPVFEFGII